MFTKSKTWMAGGGVWKPKNPHSLEHLKYLHSVLCKNQTVTEQNLSLLVETLRSISEILIWGDQNDSSVFDFFLEKNMLLFFLRFMRQKSGRYICIQLLQTLNILFDNISNETSVYYLLSNNHINSIIIHKFDFSDEEVMAYYISFLKTLSLKLNKHTIHFFYNEHTNDFALYTEAIKFFNQSESMVRIAVRTITLNVYRACRFTSQLDEYDQPIVEDKCMLRYIRDKTAAPYFSNLVYFIGHHVLTLDACIRNDIDHNSRNRLSDLVAEHLDELHYLNDILCLNIDALNEVLTDHLLNRLLIPLYIYSVKQEILSGDNWTTDQKTEVERKRLSRYVSLFLLSQVLLILHHPPLVRQLAEIIFNDEGALPISTNQRDSTEPMSRGTLRTFLKPEPLVETLEKSCGFYSSLPPDETDDLQMTETASAVARQQHPISNISDADVEVSLAEAPADNSAASDVASAADCPDISAAASSLVPHPNSTDEEKLLQHNAASALQSQSEFSLINRPYLEAIFSALDCTVDDYQALFALCLLYALGHNDGINQKLLDSVLMPSNKSQTKHNYNMYLVQKLIEIMSLSCQSGSKIRLATLELTVRLLRSLIYKDGHCFLQDCHLASVEGVREEATLQLRNFYKVWEKSEEIFLDMFEDEYRELCIRPLNVEYMTMDASILLPPTGTPLTGIDFSKRLPCGEVERARRAIRVFFLIRDLSYTLRQEPENDLPLTKDEECVKVNDVLDLNNSDLIACTIVTAEKKERRFLVIDILQLILVEPDSKRLGWGVVRFVGFLQDVEVTGDKEDSRCLHVTIHKPTMNFTHGRPLPLLSARFVFDDHIRCMAAKQRLTKGRLKARQRKMQMIARLLDLPAHLIDSLYPQSVPHSAVSLRTSHPGQAVPGTCLSLPGRSRQIPTLTSAAELSKINNAVESSVFASVDQVPGFNAVAREQELRGTSNRPSLKLPGAITSQQPSRNLRLKTTTTTTSGETVDAKRNTTKLLLTMAKEAKRSRDLRIINEATSAAESSSHSSGRRLGTKMAEDSSSPRRSKEQFSSQKAPGGAAKADDETCVAGSSKGHSLEEVCDEDVDRSRSSENEVSSDDRCEGDDQVKGSINIRRKSNGNYPKSLTPAEGLPASLVISCDDVPMRPSQAFMDSPVKLVPPVEPNDIHKLTTSPSSSSQGGAEQSCNLLLTKTDVIQSDTFDDDIVETVVDKDGN